MDATEVAQLRGGSGKAGPIASADSDLGSLVEKGLGYGPSNPPATASHQDAFTNQFKIHSPTSTLVHCVGTRRQRAK